MWTLPFSDTRGVQTIISASKISSSVPPRVHMKPSRAKKVPSYLSARRSCSAWTPSSFALTLDKLIRCRRVKTKNLDVGHGLWFLRASDKWLPTGTHQESCFLTTSTNFCLCFCLCSTISEHVQVRGGNSTDWGTQLIGRDWPIICGNQNLLDEQDGKEKGKRFILL